MVRFFYFRRFSEEKGKHNKDGEIGFKGSGSSRESLYRRWFFPSISACFLTTISLFSFVIIILIYLFFISSFYSNTFLANRTTFLKDKLLPAAIERWQSLLSVVPVNGPLYAHRECTSYWPQVSPYACAEFAPVTGCGNNGQDIPINFDSTMLGADVNYTSSLSPVYQPAGTGFPNTDFVLFVTAKQSTRCGAAGSGVLAYALTCQRDQFDRPIFGRANFCPANLDENPEEWDGQLGVAIHEMAHALGFSATSWPLFRNTDADRTPRTARDSRYPDQPAQSVTYSCSGFQYSGYVVNSSTVNYVSERGMSCSLPNNMPPYKLVSDCVHKLVTPRVMDAVREFFDCPTLNGAELENQLTSPCDLQGSHWEQRIFNTELMSSYTQHIMRISAVTLAVFEDSGWYVGNYSNIDGWRSSLDWGYHQGCAFATDKCIDAQGNGLGNPPHFYSTDRAISGASGNAVCTTDRLAMGYVDVGTYSGALSSQYQYFSDPKAGGLGPNVLDYCPAIQYYNNRICGSASSNYASSFIFGEYFGPGGICLESNLRKSTYQTTGNGAGCFRTYCNAQTLIVTVESNNYTCTTAGQSLTVPTFSGAITCPDPLVVCAVPYKYVANNNFGLPPLPSPSRSPLPSATPTPSTSPAVSIFTFPFVFPGLNMTYVLGIGLNNIPTGSLFLTRFLQDLALATGTSTQLIYVHSVLDKRSGTTAQLGYNSNTNAIYIMNYLTGNPGTRDEVTLTIGYRATVAAPSPNAGGANPVWEPLDSTVLANRRTVITNRLNTIVGNSGLFASSFSNTQSTYCSLVTSSDLLIAHSSGTCASAALACITSGTSTVGSTTPFVGIQIGPSSAPTSVKSDNMDNKTFLAAAIGGGVGGLLLIIIIIAVSCYCCKSNNSDGGGNNGGKNGPMVIDGSSVSMGSTNSSKTAVHQPRNIPRTQQYVVTVPGNQQGSTRGPLSSLPPNTRPGVPQNQVFYQQPQQPNYR